MDITKTQKELNDLYDQCSDSRNKGGKFPGMTYEDGIMAVLDWILGNTDEYPFED